MATAIRLNFPDILKTNATSGTGPVRVFVGKDPDHLQLAGILRLTHDEMQDFIGMVIQSKTVDGDLEINEQGDITAVTGIIDAETVEEEPVINVVAPRHLYTEDF